MCIRDRERNPHEKPAAAVEETEGGAGIVDVGQAERLAQQADRLTAVSYTHLTLPTSDLV